MPIPGDGRAAFQPMWAEDVAQCVLAALPGGALQHESDGARYELAGPETLTHEDIVEIALRSFHRRRKLIKIPVPIVRRTLNAAELLMGPAAFATWDEAELLEIPMTSRHGTADAERLGVLPKSMRAVLGVG
jgi:uncharacterized protein YbjT (DUF2867 family)